MSIELCEASQNYLWHLGDKVGSGATSDVYKAYNIATGEIVAAKVSKLKPAPRDTRSANQSIFDREINLLKNAHHDNIVRFIGTETVTTSNDPSAPPNREVLFLEFCNAGSVGDILRLPANRYGLPEDSVTQIMKDVTSALKYLHQKKIIHRDIKPDNIMQSIDVNGKTTYKLTDLGVARQIDPDESTSYSIRGTEEYVHPVVYCQVFPEIKVNVNGKPIGTRVQFPFEVEMWSFGVTIYQCSTGRIPFQPFEGTRNDRDTMRQILTHIPTGCISGIQSTYNGEIQYSKGLPKWCRLSSNLKDMLEKLLSRLFETNHDRLMKHEEFFAEVDEILHLIPVYYLNLKRLTLTCTYFSANNPINKLFDQIRQENGDEANIEYYCLFQNVYYSICKKEQLSIKTFYERLPVPPSSDKPLVIYTLSPLKFDQKTIPKVDIPEIQPLKNLQDVFLSNYDWSKNIVGLFFYLKTQLIEYEYIMKTTQLSITTINRFLKSKLFKLICVIRDEIFRYQPIYELQRIADVIDAKKNSGQLNRPYHKSIVKSSNQPNLLTIKPTLQSATNLYKKLIDYDKELTKISEQNFNDQVKTATDRQPIFNTKYLFKQINKYSLYIQQMDKYINDAMDLSEKFRRDTMTNGSSSLQMTSHILRQKLLQEVHDQLIRLINEECYPLILEIFNEYRKLIKHQAETNYDLHRIRLEYEEQSKNNISIDQLREIIANELEEMDRNDDDSSSIDYSFLIQSVTTSEIPQLTNPQVGENFSYLSNNASFNDISSTMQKTLKQAENNANMLNDMIRELRQQRKSLPIN